MPALPPNIVQLNFPALPGCSPAFLNARLTCLPIYVILAFTCLPVSTLPAYLTLQCLPGPALLPPLSLPCLLQLALLCLNRTTLPCLSSLDMTNFPSMDLPSSPRLTLPGTSLPSWLCPDCQALPWLPHSAITVCPPGPACLAHHCLSMHDTALQVPAGPT
jgi:hypothetical protein